MSEVNKFRSKIIFDIREFKRTHQETHQEALNVEKNNFALREEKENLIYKLNASNAEKQLLLEEIGHLKKKYKELNNKR